ncbi:MAG: putative metal-binding motif-containing protein [Pseudomonadota bacterium]|nr:putative metal-binding motif-containing protein [Pseudomonadota bacterium]
MTRISHGFPQRVHPLLRGVTILALCIGAGCAGSGNDPSKPNDPTDTASAERRFRRDADKDGYARAPWGRDCDDTRAAVNPGAKETCATTYDDNCNLSTNELNATACTTYYADADGDGYGDAADDACYCTASGSYDTLDRTDCDDASAAVNPGETEISSDGIDQDCDGVDTGGTDPVDPDPVDPDPGGTGDAPLYGFWGLNGYTSASGFADVRDRLGMTVFQVACDTPNYCINTLLPMVKAAGLKVTFRMTPDHSVYTTSGRFDIALWKAQLAEWEGWDIQPFIDDGTFVGHMLLDDIRTFSSRNPTGDELDEMARFSKEMFPGLMTFVRERASMIPVPSGGEYLYVDACVNQYETLHGDVRTYAAENESEALALNLGVINGLNIADGGDGSSGQAGWRTGFFAMSAEEIVEYGDVMATVPSMGMFLNWEYDGNEAWSDGTIGDTYFNQPEFETALSDLAALVGSHEPVTLLKP